ncbi:MAG: hypothetical protein V2B19_01905 [Pseudomonadota bacterium]
MSDSEFLPVWKKYPGVADTMIMAHMGKNPARKTKKKGRPRRAAPAIS